MSPDGVSYISIAKNLILHARLERLGSPHLRYAPGYPIFIAPAFLFARPFLAVQSLQWIYALALMWGVYLWFARYTGKSAIWIAALTLASAGYWDLFRTASSEIVFAPCLIWSAVFMAKCLDTPRPALPLLSAILFGAAACATRQAGAMLVPGFVLALLLRAATGRMNWHRAAILALIFTCSLAAFSAALIAFDRWGIHQVPGDTGYASIFLKSFQLFTSQLAEGIRRQIAEIGRLLIPGMWKTHSKEHEYLNINNLIYAVVFIPVAIGWWRFCRETNDPFALAFPLFLALYIIYPYDSGTRFTVPIFAVLSAALWYLLKFHPANRAAFFLVFILIHTLVSIGFWIDDASHVRARYQRWPEIERLAATIPSDAREIALRIDAPRGDIDDRWMFLMYLTDKPVAPETLRDPIAPEADWIITTPTEPLFPGFQFVAQIGDYQIEKRIPLK
jgi:hypothetical protein